MKEMLTGSILAGKYRLTEVIGRGGMGIVYAAWDLRLRKEWAVKRIAKGPAGVRSAGQERLLKAEINALTRLDHPRLPRIVDVAEDDKAVYLIMDRVYGRTLEELIRTKGAQNVQDVADWLFALADLLEYLHGQDPPLIYRDLKPANLMLCRDGSIKLVDLGALYTGHESGRAGIFPGTRGFTAPELFQGAQPKPTADIYSFGITGLCLLNGTLRPETEEHSEALKSYTGNANAADSNRAESDERKACAANRNEMEPVTRSTPSDSAKGKAHAAQSAAGSLRQILGKCCEKDPARRYPNCQALRSDLLQWQYECLKNERTPGWRREGEEPGKAEGNARNSLVKALGRQMDTSAEKQPADHAKNRMRRKARRYLLELSAALSVLILAGQIAMDQAEAGRVREYEELLLAAGDPAMREQDYFYMIEELDGSRTEAYHLLLDCWKEQGFFAEESERFGTLLRQHQQEIQGREDYPELIYETGIANFFYLTGEDVSFRVRVEKAKRYFELAVDLGDPAYPWYTGACRYRLLTDLYLRSYLPGQESRELKIGIPDPAEKQRMEQILDALTAAEKDLMEEQETDYVRLVFLREFGQITYFYREDFACSGIGRDSVLGFLQQLSEDLGCLHLGSGEQQECRQVQEDLSAFSEEIRMSYGMTVYQ